MSDEKYYRDMLAVIDSNIASGKLNDLQMEIAVEDRLFITAELQNCLNKKNKLDPAGLERAAKAYIETIHSSNREKRIELIIRAYLGTEASE